MKAPSISIIIPAYNTEIYLDKCVTSLCRQTYGDFEAIIIDNGSTDQTGSIADRWARTDDRVTVIHTENNGVAEARNTGLRHAHGRYIGFVDSDD
ncbi:MAG: glycosyltransferase family 2 protein, partial [Bacteroidales bacterium]|nr:glycosyltransferase family 2 protein [Bacteroidales bacterium]